MNAKSIPALPAVLVFLTLPLVAQEKQNKNDKKDLEATVLDMAGSVEVKRPGEQKWSDARKDMKLKKDTEVSTAYGSKCVLQIEDGTTKIKVEVGSMTLIKIDETAKLKGKIEADLNIKFGTIEFDVKKGDLDVDMKVSTPNSTTSVRGTEGRISHFADHARAMSDRSMTGGQMQAIARISSVSIDTGTVTVTDEAGDMTQTVDSGEILSSPDSLPMDCTLVQDTVSMPYYGATTEESSLTTDSNATVDSTTTYLQSNLTTEETTTFIQVIQQQSSNLPGPPPPPGQ